MRPRTSIVSLSELINERGRSLIQIIERMPLTMLSITHISPRLSADAILRILESDESFVIPS